MHRNTSYFVWTWWSCSFFSHCISAVLPVFTQGCHSVSFIFFICFQASSVLSFRLMFMLSDVLCDNPGNCCGNSPIATVFIVTPTPKSAQVIVDRKSLIISLSSLFPVYPSAALAVHYCTSIKHNVFIKD